MKRGYPVTYPFKNGVACGIVNKVEDGIVYIDTIGAATTIDLAPVDEVTVIEKNYYLDEDGRHHDIDGCGKEGILVRKVIYGLKLCWDCVFKYDDSS